MKPSISPLVYVILSSVARNQMMSKETRISEMKILAAVADVYNISIETLLKRENKKRVITEPRQMAMLFMRKYTPLRYDKIGKMFDKPFDHTTVIHGVTVIQNDIDTNEVVMRRYFEVEQQLFNENTIGKWQLKSK